jgi:hypothetical protein
LTPLPIEVHDKVAILKNDHLMIAATVSGNESNSLEAISSHDPNQANTLVKRRRRRRQLANCCNNTNNVVENASQSSPILNNINTKI